MALRSETISLPSAGPGVSRQLKVLRFLGAKPGPKAYVQAALHADEIPALLVAQHLRARLEALDAADALCGEIVLLPYANPIGLTQFVHGWHIGRFELDSGANFNRGFPDLYESVATRVAPELGADAPRNIATIRKAIVEASAELPTANSENAFLKQVLFRLACDADVVLDLHCDYEASLHTYIGTPLWPDAADLADCLGSRVNLLSSDSGGAAFDEAHSGIWWRLAQHFPQHPIPPACFAATVELRGERDVSDELAAQDADALLRFLLGRGFAAQPAPIDKPATTASATPLEAVDAMPAPAPGVLSWALELGTEVSVGTVLGHVVDVENGQRQAIAARTAGIFFARRGHRFARPDQWVAKIAGSQPLAWRKPGALLSGRDP